jgi:hypothetical protein
MTQGMPRTPNSAIDTRCCVSCTCLCMLCVDSIDSSRFGFHSPYTQGNPLSVTLPINPAYDSKQRIPCTPCKRRHTLRAGVLDADESAYRLQQDSCDEARGRTQTTTHTRAHIHTRARTHTRTHNTHTSSLQADPFSQTLPEYFARSPQVAPVGMPPQTATATSSPNVPQGPQGPSPRCVVRGLQGGGVCGLDHGVMCMRVKSTKHLLRVVNDVA